MLKMDMLNLGIYWVNSYIIRDESSTTCCVIDPGGHPKKVLDYLQKNGLTLEAILLTHGHFDHVGAVKDLVAATGCKVYLHTADLTIDKVAIKFFEQRKAEKYKIDVAHLDNESKVHPV